MTVAQPNRNQSLEIKIIQIYEHISLELKNFHFQTIGNLFFCLGG